MAAKPAMVAGDAVTLLSRAWQDARSEAGKTSRVPTDTTFNTVVMTGNTPTVPPQGMLPGEYNGGLENVLRFLEHWTGVTVTYRGSIVDLWFSDKATGDWNSTYYSPPLRDWGYHDIYRTAAPPGVPRVYAVEDLTWEERTWAQEGWL